MTDVLIEHEHGLTLIPEVLACFVHHRNEFCKVLAVTPFSIVHDWAPDSNAPVQSQRVELIVLHHHVVGVLTRPRARLH